MSVNSGPEEVPHRRFLPVAIAVAVVVALAAGALVFIRFAGTGDVTLEPVAEPGPDPFTSSVSVREVAAFSDTVQAAVTTVAEPFEPSDENGPYVTTGLAPGLYGGFRDDAVCNAAALSAFLAEREDEASAWSSVHGIEPDQIDVYLSGLTPVLLTHDTVVTNHGFAGGSVVARQSVLQAGTAVLVDGFGVPRVRCACGNPLLEPEANRIDSGSISGQAWPGFSVDQTVIVEAGEDDVQELQVTDIDTAELRVQPTGSTVTPALIASSAVDTYGSVRGEIHLSSDGEEWQKVLESTPLYDVAVGDDLVVAVGSADGTAAGVILHSIDAQQWSEPIEVTDPLRSVAYGDGVWVAVGDRSFSEYGGAGDGSGGAIYRSTDGRTWTRVLETSPYDNAAFTDQSQFRYQSMLSVGYGDGQWLAVGSECLVESHCVLAQFTSGDGLTWDRSTLGGTLTRIDVAHDGAQWAMVGGELVGAGVVGVDQLNDHAPVAGTSGSAGTWSIGEISSGGSVLRGLTSAPSGWFAVDYQEYDPDLEPAPSTVFFSADLQSWEVIGGAVPGVTGLAMMSPSTDLPESVITEPASDEAALLRLHGDYFEVLDDKGEQLVDVDYSQSSGDALGVLSELLGSPVAEYFEGDNTCFAESNQHSWGQLMLWAPTAPEAGWTLSIDDGEAIESTIATEVAGGIGIGADQAEVEGAHVGAPSDSYSWEGVDYETLIVEQTADSDTGNPRGVRILLEDGLVTFMTSRSYLYDMC